MLRRILILLAALMVAGVVAMGQELAPTTGDGPDAVAKGENSASVNQEVQLILPRANALHLDVTTLKFDLTAMDGANWPNSTFDFGGQMLCYYGKSNTDIVTPLNATYFNQTQYLPLGVGYANAPSGWPNIVLTDTAGAVTAYPPIKLDATTGELVPGSKNYFVCFRTFKLQKFTNGEQWDLSVTRSGTTVGKEIDRLYIQDNPCDTFGAPTGLYKINVGDTLRLVPESLAVGPTGKQVADAKGLCGYKSWLDDLVVMAVVVDGDYAGTNHAQLQYTLSTSTWDP